MTEQANEGVNWETVARAGAVVLFSIALGAGGFFVTQQASHDSRQDLLLDTISTKLVDISITLVKIQQSATDAKTAADKAQSAQEERDQRELSEYRRHADDRKK